MIRRVAPADYPRLGTLGLLHRGPHKPFCSPAAFYQATISPMRAAKTSLSSVSALDRTLRGNSLHDPNVASSEASVIRLLAILWLVLTALSCRAEPVIGVNVNNPQWLPVERRAAIVDELAAASVRAVRVPYLPSMEANYSTILDFIERLHGRGIGVHLVMWPQYPADAPRRTPGTPSGWPQPGLSKSDPERLRALASDLFQKLDTAGIRLVGLELDNEINWTEFNGDIPVPGQGRTLKVADLQASAAGRAVLAGFDAYLRSLAVLKAMRDASTQNRTTPIILAGLSDPSPEWPTPFVRADAVDHADTLAYLKAHGLDALVDGYGAHTYTGPGLTDAQRREHLRRYVLLRCRPAGDAAGKPCWLTEWGMPLPTTSCPPDDAKRLPLVKAFRADLAPRVADGSVVALFYYPWDGQVDRLGIHVCGALTASGRVALSPEGAPLSRPSR